MIFKAISVLCSCRRRLAILLMHLLIFNPDMSAQATKMLPSIKNVYLTEITFQEQAMSNIANNSNTKKRPQDS
jgi:hypothetical protein